MNLINVDKLRKSIEESNCSSFTPYELIQILDKQPIVKNDFIMELLDSGTTSMYLTENAVGYNKEWLFNHIDKEMNRLKEEREMNT